jgi:SAM-dependent methyltransferase
MNDYVRSEAERRGLANVETVLASESDSGIPPGAVDLVFTCNTYHHLPDPPEYFRRLRAALRPGGRLAVVDFKPEGFFQKRHASGDEAIRADLGAAGYELEAEHGFLERQHFLVFRPVED